MITLPKCYSSAKVLALDTSPASQTYLGDFLRYLNRFQLSLESNQTIALVLGLILLWFEIG